MACGLCKKRKFTLTVMGDSMEPEYHDGDIIVIDPEIPAENGKDVLVSLDNCNAATFRQLVIVDGKQFLKARNPEWDEPLQEISSNDEICGVVTFSGKAC